MAVAAAAAGAARGPAASAARAAAAAGPAARPGSGCSGSQPGRSDSFARGSLRPVALCLNCGF